MNDPLCPFCRMVAGSERASYVWEDPDVFGIMSLEQPTPYKVLVIPKLHVASLFDLTDDLAASLFRTTVKVAKAIRAVSQCPGLNLVQSNGRVGQQDVAHFHLHIVPRFENDGITLAWDNTKTERPRLDALAEEIRIQMK
jgi:histidine triad (HIT) family protein